MSQKQNKSRRGQRTQKLQERKYTIKDTEAK